MRRQTPQLVRARLLLSFAFALALCITQVNHERALAFSPLNKTSIEHAGSRLQAPVLSISADQLSSIAQLPAFHASDNFNSSLVFGAVLVLLVRILRRIA